MDLTVQTYIHLFFRAGLPAARIRRSGARADRGTHARWPPAADVAIGMEGRRPPAFGQVPAQIR